jgi:hypothetical protein
MKSSYRIVNKVASSAIPPDPISIEKNDVVVQPDQQD